MAKIKNTDNLVNLEIKALDRSIKLFEKLEPIANKLETLSKDEIIELLAECEITLHSQRAYLDAADTAHNLTATESKTSKLN